MTAETKICTRPFSDKVFLHVVKFQNWVISVFLFHPNLTGLSYPEHLFQAWNLAMRSLFAGLVLIIHGIFPFVFEDTGTAVLIETYHQVAKYKRE